LYILPTPSRTSITLLTSPPLISYTLDPLLLFFSPSSQPIKELAHAIDRVPEEEAKILRFVRTPEGRGVGVVRSEGGGEAWVVRGRGTRLGRGARWRDGDCVVVLDKGDVHSCR
jgi:hypothetical protein